jgi:hypothetical protein
MNPIANATVSNEQSSSSGGSHDAGESSSWPAKPELTEEMLLRFVSRAASRDGESGFFEEGIEELPETKHPLVPLPVEFGGAGMTLTEVCREAGSRRKP